MPKRRRHFSPEFKAEVVDLVLQHGRTVSDVCREMDLAGSAVRRRVRQAQVDQGDSAEGALATAERDVP